MTIIGPTIRNTSMGHTDNVNAIHVRDDMNAHSDTDCANRKATSCPNKPGTRRSVLQSPVFISEMASTKLQSSP